MKSRENFEKSLPDLSLLCLKLYREILFDPETELFNMVYVFYMVYKTCMCQPLLKSPESSLPNPFSPQHSKPYNTNLTFLAEPPSPLEPFSDPFMVAPMFL